MFAYLFVWETLGIPQRHHRETREAQRLCGGVLKTQGHSVPEFYYVALFGINRTNDRPAETFVCVVFHSMRIMYVNLVTVYANFAQEAH